MASIEEVYEKVIADDAEKAAFAEAARSPETLEAFLSAHDCAATPAEVASFVKSKQGEMADGELDSVAGGACGDPDPRFSAMTNLASCY